MATTSKSTEESTSTTDPTQSATLSNKDQSKVPLIEQNAEKIVTALAPENSAAEIKNATEKMVKQTVKLDDFYQLGSYTYIVCLFAELLILSQVGNMLYMTYAGAAPSLVSCGTHQFLEKTAKERCNALNELLGDSTKSINHGCSNETLIWNQDFNSVNVEFGHHCQSQLVKSTISYQMVGVIIGSMIFGYLSDSYGRKKIMLIALVCCILCMVATSFTYDLITFTIVRFFVNFFNAGTMVILVVFTSEHYPNSHRFCLSNLITCESPRFLIQSRRIDEAKKAIIRMHKIDGRPYDEAVIDSVLEGLEKQSMESSNKNKKYNYLHLFYTLRFTRYTLAVAFSFLAVSIMNYSLLYNMDKLSGSIFKNGIFMGLFRYSMNLTIGFLDMYVKRLGRKFAHFMADSLASFGNFNLCYLQQDLSFISRASILSVIGFCSILYTTNGLASNELFPTAIRNTSYSFGQVLSRIGVVLAPQLFVLFNVFETKGKPMLSKFPSKEERIFYGRIPLRRRQEKRDVELMPREGGEKIDV
uniref:MFS domain-containing protein n=1 Tax=Meloidogyne hapla TaxID=6305 RepID=A0A1I8BY67_MELHA